MVHTTIHARSSFGGYTPLDMVKLTKIYTRTGDQGTTGLGSGKRVNKHDPRVEAYGMVDETNATLGLCVCTARSENPDIANVLEAIEHDLFDLGADLCMPIEKDEPEGKALRITSKRVEALEALIDQYNSELAPLNSFVLPGGSRLAAELHLARTICRRAERSVALLLEIEPEQTSSLTMQFLNRLSDLLFVLSRYVNKKGEGDVLWVPGKNRSE